VTCALGVKLFLEIATLRLASPSVLVAREGGNNEEWRELMSVVEHNTNLSQNAEAR